MGRACSDAGFERWPTNEAVASACRNGPGEFVIGGQELAHPFDGHGLVASIAFRGGRAFMRSRFVRTEECAGPAQHPSLAA